MQTGIESAEKEKMHGKAPMRGEEHYCRSCVHFQEFPAFLHDLTEHHSRFRIFLPVWFFSIRSDFPVTTSRRLIADTQTLGELPAVHTPGKPAVIPFLTVEMIESSANSLGYNESAPLSCSHGGRRTD